jgi:hypothetical protein
MADPFKHVQPGDDFIIGAKAYNAFADAAKDFHQKKLSRTSQTTPGMQSQDTILVRNQTGGPRKRFEILGINEPVFAPSDDDAEAFKNHPVMIGVVPGEQHEGRFVVLLEPVADRTLARALVVGAVPTRIWRGHADPQEDTHADIEPGVTNHLRAKRGGSAAILWRLPGTDAQWSLIRLGNATESVPVVKYIVIRSIYGGETNYCSAQEIKRNRITGDLEIAGPPMDVFTWPNTPSRHFAPFVWLGEDLVIPPEAHVLPATFDGQDWSIWQYFRFNAAVDPGSEWPFSDCTVRG